MGLWKEYVDYSGLPIDTPHEEWPFGSDPDVLGDLVEKGIKTGTASLYDCYVAENELVPKVGCYSVILDSQDKELCVIQTYSVRIVPFSQVDHYHAYTEGEDDRTLSSWRDVHQRFFCLEAENSQIPLSPDPLVVLEKFRVVYPPALAPQFSLVQPEAWNLDAVQEYKDAFFGREEELHGTCGLGRRTDLEAWYQEGLMVSHPDYENNEEFVQATQLFLRDNTTGKLLGAIHMRHALNRNLALSGGHIGYSVRPDERGKGYASLMLRMTLSYAKALGLEKVLLTCEVENEGSRRTILSAGGNLEDTVYDEDEKSWFQRYWVNI